MNHQNNHVRRRKACMALALSMLLLLTACETVPEGASVPEDSAVSAAAEEQTEAGQAAEAGEAETQDSAGNTEAAKADENADAAENAEAGENSGVAQEAEAETGAGADETVETGDDTIHYIRLNTTSPSDSFLIMSQGVTMLVDTSNPDPTTHGNYALADNTANVKTVVDYLSSLGIQHLDYLVMTHNHSDHIGGVTTLCNLHFVDENTVVYSRSGQSTQEDINLPEWQNMYYYQIAVDAVKGTGAEFHSLQDEGVTDLTVKVGNFDVKFVNLDLDGDGQVDFDEENENNNSLALKVTKGSIDTLLTADIEIEEEQAMVDALDLSDIEVLKVPHHGSLTSSSYPFLKELQPEAAIVTQSVYLQLGACMYMQSVVGTDIYMTHDGSEGAIVETVYQDHFTIENGALYNDTDANGAGWVKWFDKYVYSENGAPVVSSWRRIDGDWYYFDEDGIMATGELTVKGRDYYLGEDGKMQTGFINVNGRLRFYAPWDGAAVLPGMPWFGGNGGGAEASPAPSDAPPPAASPTESAVYSTLTPASPAPMPRPTG